MGLLALAGLWKGVGDSSEMASSILPRFICIPWSVSFPVHASSLRVFISSSLTTLVCEWGCPQASLFLFTISPLIPIFPGFRLVTIPPFTFHVLDLTKAFGALFLFSSLPHFFLVSFSIMPYFLSTSFSSSFRFVISSLSKPPG